MEAIRQENMAKINFYNLRNEYAEVIAKGIISGDVDNKNDHTRHAYVLSINPDLALHLRNAELSKIDSESNRKVADLHYKTLVLIHYGSERVDYDAEEDE